jgi:hypothetical protein
MATKSGWPRGFYRMWVYTCPLEVQPACVQNVKMQNRGPVKHAVFEFALVLWFIVMAVRSNAALDTYVPALFSRSPGSRF